MAHRFKAAFHVVDATTIALIASCMDWARHRRGKAAAKCHLRLDLRSQLPRFALIDTACESDARRAREVCAGIRLGEIVLSDKAYVHYAHLFVPPTGLGAAQHEAPTGASEYRAAHENGGAQGGRLAPAALAGDVGLVARLHDAGRSPAEPRYFGDDAASKRPTGNPCA